MTSTTATAIYTSTPKDTTTDENILYNYSFHIITQTDEYACN